MRLHPPVTEEAVRRWLDSQVEHLELKVLPPDLEKTLASTARAMAAISQVILPDECEPYFP
jgi:hypothetical protein